VGTTAFLTINFSIFGVKYMQGFNHGYNRTTIEDVLLISCDCKRIEKVKQEINVKEALTFKDNLVFKYVLKNCNSINTKEISKKVLERLIKKEACIKFNIDVKLYNKQNDSTSFQINNCNIELNE